MKQHSPLLTMGMPVYNEENYIGETIESLLSQTFKDFILIISDNNSLDHTPEICKYYAEKDKRIVFVRHAENKGVFFNFKYVLDKANTPFFMWCGGHNRWDPQFVEKLLPLIQNEDLILVYPQTREIKIDGTLGKIYQENLTTVKIERPIDRYLYILNRTAEGYLFYGIWKTQMLKNCYFKPVICFDTLILLRAALLGKFKHIEDILFFEKVIRTENSENMYRRQISMILGKNFQKIPSTFLLRGQFIFENVKMIYKINPRLSVISKLILSTQATYTWIRRFYINPFLVKILKNLVKILKKILPDRTYLSLKDKVKGKIKKYL
jgi:glycosyltransferase involved in cell wall biosynthesis